MTREEAIKIVVKQYKELKKLALNIENNIAPENKGMYHQDVTQDLFIKIQNEIDSIENEPNKLDEFVEERIKKPLFYFTAIKHMLINEYKKESKTISIDKMSFKDRRMLIDEIKLKENEEKIHMINKYVKTWYWFDRKLFNLYIYEYSLKPKNMSHGTGLSISTINRTVKRCKMKIQNKFKNEK